MAPRQKLQDLLLTLVPNVYFQPAENIKMVYPCVVYQRDASDSKFADNFVYRYTKRYLVTYIDRDVDSPVPDQIALLPLCTFSRFFTADNLNHDAFELYF